MHSQLALCVYALLASFVLASSAFAIDIPYGGDGMVHQMRIADAVATVQPGPSDTSFVTLVRRRSIAGETPAEIRIRRNGVLGPPPALKEGGLYLVYLKKNSDGSFDLPLGSYSALEIPREEEESIARAALSVRRDLQRPDALRSTLLWTASESSGYVQYSSTVGLETKGMIGREELGQLMSMWARRDLADKRAKRILVRQTVVLGATEHISMLEKAVTSPEEAVVVQLDALTSLHAMNRDDIVRGLAPTIRRSGSAHLKRRLQQIESGARTAR